MKRLIPIVLSFLLMSSVAFASPFIVCDPYPVGVSQPDQFILTIDAGSPITSPAETLADGTKRLKYDLAGISTGTHSVTVKARIDLWGLESTSVPFSLEKPSVAASPAGLKLVK